MPTTPSTRRARDFSGTLTAIGDKYNAAQAEARVATMQKNAAAAAAEREAEQMRLENKALRGQPLVPGDFQALSAGKKSSRRGRPR